MLASMPADRGLQLIVSFRSLSLSLSLSHTHTHTHTHAYTYARACINVFKVQMPQMKVLKLIIVFIYHSCLQRKKKHLHQSPAQVGEFVQHELQNVHHSFVSRMFIILLFLECSFPIQCE